MALAVLYSAITPLGEGPDEPGHARYVFFLAREGRLPIQRAEASASDVPGEGHQPPLAYALMAPLAAWLPLDQRQFDLPGNTRFTWAGGSELNAVGHGSREYMPWKGFVLAWHLARLVSVALGAATVVLTYMAASAFNFRFWVADFGLDQSKIQNPRSQIPLLAAALVAFNPQWIFSSALVTNDALLVALSALLLWLVARQAARPQGSSRAALGQALALGLVLGLALLTKQSAVALVPVALLSVLWQPRRKLGQRALAAGCLLGTMLLICGWWYVRNWQLYGDLFGLGAFQAEFATQPFEVGSPQAWFGALKQLHSSFWARFGWMNVRPPAWAIWLYTLVELAGLLGLLRTFLKTRRPGDQETGPQADSALSILQLPAPMLRYWPLLALPALAFTWLLSFALAAGLVAWQGRLLFPALPALAIVLAYGLAASIETKRQTDRKTSSLVSVRSWSLILLSILAIVALWLPFGTIKPAYPFYTLPETTALAQLGTPVYGRLGLAGERGAELRGWRLDGAARPGATLELTLMWHALARQNRNWTVFIHVVDAQEQIVTEENRQPLDGIFPMKQWVEGDWVEDQHTLVLPADLAPGQYHVRVGLWDPRTTRRAGVYSQRNRLRGDYMDLTSLTIGASAYR